MKKIAFMLLLAVSFTACTVTRTTIGSGPVGKDPAKVFDKTHQRYLIQGIFPLGFSQSRIPDDKNFQIKTSFTFIDALLTGITGGFYRQQTIEILVKP